MRLLVSSDVHIEESLQRRKKEVPFECELRYDCKTYITVELIEQSVYFGLISVIGEKEMEHLSEHFNQMYFKFLVYEKMV